MNTAEGAELVSDAEAFGAAFDQVAAEASAATVAAAAPVTAPPVAAPATTVDDAAAKVTADAAAAAEAAAKVTADAAAKVTADAAEAAVRATADAAAKVAADAAKVTADTAAKVARDAEEAARAPYQFQPDETAALAQFEKDFPVEHKAMMARFKSQEHSNAAAVHAAKEELMKTIAPRLAAVETVAGDAAVERHFTAVKAAHKDFDAMVPKVAEWIKTQPAYLQPAMRQVYDGGTTDDVIALFTQYAAANPVKADDTATADAAKAAAAAKAVADAAAAAAAKVKATAAAAALEPVAARRTAPVGKGAADANDFEGAWNELAAASVAGNPK